VSHREWGFTILGNFRRKSSPTGIKEANLPHLKPKSQIGHYATSI
jgi:hypothetical protein